VAVPVSQNNLCRYAAYLGHSRSYATVQEYLNVIRIMHLERGYENPLNEFHLQNVLKGIKRCKGNSPNYKLALLSEQLVSMHALLN
jgi:hypothetical protein